LSEFDDIGDVDTELKGAVQEAAIEIERIDGQIVV